MSVPVATVEVATMTAEVEDDCGTRRAQTAVEVCNQVDASTMTHTEAPGPSPAAALAAWWERIVLQAWDEARPGCVVAAVGNTHPPRGGGGVLGLRPLLAAVSEIYSEKMVAEAVDRLESNPPQAGRPLLRVIS